MLGILFVLPWARKISFRNFIFPYLISIPEPEITLPPADFKILCPAGHSILKSAGGNVISGSGIEIKYGKMKFLNDIFLAHGKTKSIPNTFLIKLKNKNYDSYKRDLEESMLSSKSLL